MKKMFVSLICILLSYGVSLAENGDILSVKFMHSPVLTSTEESAQVISLLQKWYVVLDLGLSWDYTHIMLTDGKKWYMLSSYLENYTFNNYKINGNKWSIQTNTTFYSQPHSSSKQIWTLIWGTEFYILHVNYINSKFLKIKIINGPHKNKTWYIESNNVNISHLSDFKSEIQKFIEKYAKDQGSVLYLNNNSSAEYQPLFEGENVGNTVSVFQQQNKNSLSNVSSASNNNWNILNSNATSTINSSSSTKNSNSTSASTNNNSTSNNNDLNEFLKMLDSYTSTWTTSSTKNNSSSTSSSTKSTTWGWGSSTSTSTKNNSASNNSEINDFLDLLNLDKYLSWTTNSGTTPSTNTQSNNDINDFLNLLNLDNLSNQINNSSQNTDVNSFLDSLNKTLNTSSSGTTKVQETQQNDIENFLKLLNGSL